MAKKKEVANVGMVEAGAFPSQVALPGGFSISTEHPAFAEGLGMLAGALGFAPKGLFYALQYGVAQSLQDSIAGKAKAMRDEKDESGEPRYGDAEIASALHDAMAQRFAAIASGEIGHRARGPQVRGIEKLERDVAWEAIVAAAQAKGLAASLPRKAAEVNGLIDKYLGDSTRRESARAEAERRLGAAKPVDDSFLRDLVA